MSEEILKVALEELLQTVRIKKPDGVILEASNIETLRNCCSQIRAENPSAADALFQLFNAAGQITSPGFPVAVEFAVKVK